MRIIQSKKKLLLVLFGIFLMAVALPLNTSYAADEVWNANVATNFASGEGTYNSPYMIANGDQLALLEKQVNSGTHYEGCYFELANDISLNDTTNWESWSHNNEPANSWIPIGNANNQFKGHFNGEGHTVSGVYVNELNQNNAGQGLFGYVAGTVKNLGIIKSFISGVNVVGGVAGSNTGRITCCYYTGKVYGNNIVGGIAGYSNGLVDRCFNTGSITGTGNDRKIIGGVTGKYCGTIENCYNTGIVSGYTIVGGVIGEEDSGNVINCYNVGNVQGTSYYYGVAGKARDILNCFFLEGCADYGYYSIETSCNTNEGAKVLTEIQMKEQASFEDWDFSEIWEMDATGDYKYPQLRFNYDKVQIDWDGTTAEEFESGNGTENSPYIITNGAQLAFLAEQVNSGINYEGDYFKLAKDIKLNDTSEWKSWGFEYGTSGGIIQPVNSWTAIGMKKDNTEKPFKGNFDGGGHKISGIYINKSSPGDDYQGLFGYIVDGTVKNLIIAESYVKAIDYTGGIAGYSERSIIADCANTGTVYGSSYVGGVVGKITMAAITDCHNTGTVTGWNQVGGVAGVSDTRTINCYNTGSVNSNSITDSNIGGVAGECSGIIMSCYNTGDISGDNYVGGVAGNLSSAIVTMCYNTGYISGYNYAGGVAGVAGELVPPGVPGVPDMPEPSDVTIENCYNTGDVNGTNYLGGVTGAGGTIKYCYNIGYVTGMNEENPDPGTVVPIDPFNPEDLPVGPGPDDPPPPISFFSGAISGSNNIFSIEDCYFLGNPQTHGYYNTSTQQYESSDGYEKNFFASGNVCWLLNNQKSDGTAEAPLIWYQTIGEFNVQENKYEGGDATPQFSGKRVCYDQNKTPHYYYNESGGTLDLNNQSFDTDSGTELHAGDVKLSFDAAASETIKTNNTAGTNLKLEITTEETDNGTIKVSLNLTDSENNPVYSTDNAAGLVTIVLPYEKPASAKEGDIVKVYYIGADGLKQQVESFTVDEEKKTLSFTTSHFSDYEIACDSFPSLVIQSASLTLESDLSVNFYVPQSTLAAYGSEYSFVCQYNGNNSTITGEQVTKTIDGNQVDFQRFTFSDIAAKEMGEDITATLTCTNNSQKYASKQVIYSPQQYCKNMLASETSSDKIKKVCADMLNYGAEAQKYFSYKTEKLVNTGEFTKTDSEGNTDSYNLSELINTNKTTDNLVLTSHYKQDGADVLLNFKGAALVLEERVEIKISIDLSSINDDSNLSVKITKNNNESTINGTALKKDPNNVYYFYYDGLAAKEMRVPVTFVVMQDEQQVSKTLTYSIETYAFNKQDSNTRNLADLVKMMMKYGDAAANYFS